MSEGPDPAAAPAPMGSAEAGDPVEAAVRALLDRHPAAAEIAGLAEGRDAIASAELRPGLVKTFPPQVELVVTPAAGGRPRTFDLVEEVDGRLTFGRAHPHGGAR